MRKVAVQNTTARKIHKIYRLQVIYDTLKNGRGSPAN